MITTRGWTLANLGGFIGFFPIAIRTATQLGLGLGTCAPKGKDNYTQAE